MGSSASNLRMHGLVVDSFVPLHHGREDPGAADLTITEGESRACPDEHPGGRTLAALARPDGGPFYTLVAEDDGDGYVLRCHGLCDFVIDRMLTSAVCHPDPDGVPEVLPVIIAGTLMSMVLCLRGELVLHASAVEVDGRAIAFVGESGMGKTTLATWLCAAGATLITDDVLRVEPADPTVCWLGSTESRLRPAAVSLVEQFSDPSTRITGDERTALSVPISTTDRLPVRCVLVPRPDRDVARASIRWLMAGEALITLSRFPRVLGWESPRVLGEQFTALGEFAKRVPVGVATVPWGPPFDPEVPAQLLDALSGR